MPVGPWPNEPDPGAPPIPEKPKPGDPKPQKDSDAFGFVAHIVGKWQWWRTLFHWQYCSLHGWVPKWAWDNCCQFYQSP